ncbi:MAG TPA: PilZ domain-containing protein [Gemmataceae bacterium]|nr:PilZ domain-containing protein [Gemmataceae bacterium]
MPEPIDHFQNVERRAWSRYACNLSAFCRVLGDGTRLAWPARIRDVSIGGVCIQTSRKYEPSAFLAVEPGNEATVPWSTRLVHVLHARRLSDGGDWVLGCAFVSQITNEQLQICRNPHQLAGSLGNGRQGPDTNGDTEPETR